jgi:GDP-L-fucose synthase
MRKILILGANGLVGKSLVKRLEGNNLLTPSSSELNLLDYNQVEQYFFKHFPCEVYLCAAKVGGILANKNDPVGFFNINMKIGMNVLDCAKRTNVKKLMNLGSTCIYPKECPQPMKEEYLLTSELEPTNEAYALAKISILKLCEYYNKQYGTNFISTMPTNLFGENDNFHRENCHAMPSMIRKVKEAKDRGDTTIEMWGDGSPIREFMYADDLADALVFLMENYDGSNGFLNVGTGQGKTIKELYQLVMDIMGFSGTIVCDTSKPNGTLKKLTDVSKLKALGWESKISLEEGIRKTIKELESRNWKWKEK